ncbi:MAG: DEAD/DEAH box helicase [Planctomycetes bacterium]|nr:DEAD/DEAH box helicase [Planctomycetota bacterium]
MILSSFRNGIFECSAHLEYRSYEVSELAHTLGLYDFQIYSLLKEKWLIKEDNSTISAKSVKRILNETESFFNQLAVTPAELESIYEVPSETIGVILKKIKVKSFRKKKRKGQVRKLYKMGQLLKKEKMLQKAVEEYLEKANHQKESALKKYAKHEEALLERSISTAQRLADGVKPITQEASTENRFVLDDWQIGAIQALEKGEHVFVQAPTGAGKTAIVEEFLKRNLPAGVTLFYAVPIKALANDKFFDFCDLYGRERVGINTGDITLNADAPIVVGTTEIVRNILFDRPDAYQVIAFDEAQYLGDKERGGAWEESIIMSHNDTRMIFLSGSVANGPVVGAWLEKIKNRPVTLFTEDVRPVPLRYAFPYGEGFLESEDWDSLKEVSEKTGTEYYGSFSTLFAAVDRAKMTPVLLFMPRRRDCEEVFDEAIDLTVTETKRMRELLSEHHEASFLNLRLKKLIERKGCAYHHSGLLPPEKRVVEHLAKKGHLKFVSATMSLASGVNFSVRTCFISEYSRPGNGGNMQPLAPSEILQMWGRAGRRSIDVEGYLIPCKDILDIDAFKKVEAYPEPIVRENFVSPVNLLSILSRYSVEVLEELCEKSFSSYVDGMNYRVFSDPTMFRDAKAICGSPTYELSPYRQGVYAHMSQERLAKEFKCGTCENIESCTKVYEESIKYNPLQKMVKHLRMNEFLSNDFSLTLKGRIAERFHNEMGLLIAHDIDNGRLVPSNLLHYAASVSASGHIDFIGSRRRVYLDIAKKLYPMWLFPNLWERQRGRPVFINWNPGAGVVAEQWIEANDWDSFSSRPLFKNIQGDVFRMLLRTGEFLKSMSHIKDLKPELAEAAGVATKLIMRPPLIPEELFELR